MLKRKIAHRSSDMHFDESPHSNEHTPSEHVDSNEDTFPDSGFYSNDIKLPAPKRLAYVTAIEDFASEDLERAVVEKPDVRVLTDETTLATPKRANKHWLQKRIGSSPVALSSPEFEDQENESPSLNHGKFRVLPEPNKYFTSKHLPASSADQLVVRGYIERDFKGFCDGDKRTYRIGMGQLLDTYGSEYYQFIMVLQMDYNFELREALEELVDGQEQ